MDFDADDFDPAISSSVTERTSFLQPLATPNDFGISYSGLGDRTRFSDEMPFPENRLAVGVDLYSAPDFQGGLIVYGPSIGMKIGGYVKADFIYDYDPIDSTDSFDTTSIPVGAPPRQNALPRPTNEAEFRHAVVDQRSHRKNLRRE